MAVSRTDLMTGPMAAQRPITLLICALGGEGGGVLAEWLVDAAREAGYAAQSTSIPGVAQRTGATTYYVELFPVPLARLGGRRPVFSLNPVPGALDAIVSSELLETVRQIGLGFADPQQTLVISSICRTLTTQERMQLGDGRADAAPLQGIVRSFSREHQLLDMGAIAREAGTVVSAVMLGAIAGSGLFPLPRDAYEAVVRAGGKGFEASLRGFARAYDAVRLPREQAASITRLLSHSELHTHTAPSLEADLARKFPPEVHAMLALGLQRVRDYQGAGYARLYLRRLEQVLAAERAADPCAARGFATTRETARWLALWMAFDDIVRVADLKSRASRWQRVRGEVHASDTDLLRVVEFFKPGAAEFAALLPPALAARVLAWERRRIAAAREPWALPLKVGSHSVTGLLALRLLASLKWLRARGSRYAAEQTMIERWIAGVVQGSGAHWQLGHELALCGRLIKGYGTTNERGKTSLLHVLEHLAAGSAPADARAAAVGSARAAALADENGQALDRVLAEHGAPKRPVKAQPIRWMRRPGAPAAKH